jgi:hypothetical protein
VHTAVLAGTVGIQPDPVSTSKLEKIDPWRIILQIVLEFTPQPLGYALILGVTPLAGLTVIIDGAFKDFDLRLTLSSMCFLVALTAACVAWLAATILARERLSWARLPR